MVKEKFIIEKIISLILMAELICSVISKLFNIHSNINVLILGIEIILIFYGVLNKKIKITSNINTEKLLFIFNIFVLYIITIINYGVNHYNFIYLMFYCLIPLFVSSNDLKSERVLFYCMILSLFSIPVFDKLFASEFSGLNQMSMGNAYALCVPVVAGIIHYTYYYNKKYIILYLYELLILIKLLSLANRGVILEIVFSIILIKFSLFGRDEAKKKFTANYIIKCSLISIVFFLAVFNLNDIIASLNNFCSNTLNLSVTSLKKAIILLENDDLSNGRLNIIITAFELIKNKLLFGYGIRAFGLYTTHSWPHNLFIQFLFEGGILLGLYPIILFFKKVIIIIKQKTNKNTYVMNLFLLIMVIPRFMFSNDIWLIPYVWLFFGYSLRNNNISKEVKKK